MGWRSDVYPQWWKILAIPRRDSRSYAFKPMVREFRIARFAVSNESTSEDRARKDRERSQAESMEVIMDDDYERYTEKEVLEMINYSCQKVWNTCVLISLIYEGRIQNTKLLRQYSNIKRGLCSDLPDKFEKFRHDRRAWLRIFGP